MIFRPDHEAATDEPEDNLFSKLKLLADEAESKGSATLLIPEEMAAQYELEAMEQLIAEAMKLVSEARFAVHCMLLPNDSVQLTVHAEQPDPLSN
ncbi:hypothetical protein KC963_01000 [Candidatus Saccharibacteria bacterium]|nr:hypothetical protein [Candidatus Saccharibacteria bacterium]